MRYKTLLAVISIALLACTFSFAQEVTPDASHDNNLQEIYDMVGYPARAEAMGIEGDVNLRVLIDHQGNYVRHEIVGEAHRLLTEPCVDAVQKVHLPKAELDGEPMRYWVGLNFHFEKEAPVAWG